MVQLAHQQGVDVRVLSDCNTVFIDHILTGARVHGLVKQVRDRSLPSLFGSWQWGLCFAAYGGEPRTLQLVPYALLPALLPGHTGARPYPAVVRFISAWLSQIRCTL